MTVEVTLTIPEGYLEELSKWLASDSTQPFPGGREFARLILAAHAFQAYCRSTNSLHPTLSSPFVESRESSSPDPLASDSLARVRTLVRDASPVSADLEKAAIDYIASALKNERIGSRIKYFANRYQILHQSLDRFLRKIIQSSGVHKSQIGELAKFDWSKVFKGADSLEENQQEMIRGKTVLATRQIDPVPLVATSTELLARVEAIVRDSINDKPDMKRAITDYIMSCLRREKIEKRIDHFARIYHFPYQTLDGAIRRVIRSRGWLVKSSSSFI